MTTLEVGHGWITVPNERGDCRSGGKNGFVKTKSVFMEVCYGYAGPDYVSVYPCKVNGCIQSGAGVDLNVETFRELARWFLHNFPEED